MKSFLTEHPIARALLCALCLSALFSACVRESKDQVETQPVKTGPRNVLDATNGRIRCNHRNIAPNQHDVECVALVFGPDGSEHAPDGVADGVTFSWRKPKELDSSNLSFLPCVETGLDQHCTVTSANSAPSKAEFGFELSKSQAAPVPFLHTLLLPVTVETIGEVPGLTSYMPVGSNASGNNKEASTVRRSASAIAAEVRSGIQIPRLSPLKYRFGVISSVCVSGKTVFFSTLNHVYRLDKGEDGIDAVTLYAGSSNVENRDELSHRLRVAIGVPVSRAEINPLASRFDDSIGLACGEGRLWISDPTNHRVLSVTDSGPVSQLGSAELSGDSGDDGPATAARFTHPRGLALASDGSLYIADPDANRVRKLTPDGKIVAVAGNGTAGDSGNGGPAVKAQLNGPAGVAVAPNGTVYITDTENCKIRTVGTDGIVPAVGGAACGVVTL